MILMVAVLSFAILAITSFCVKRKKLHLFEILAVWFTVTAVNAPIYSYFLVNQHWLSVPDNKEMAVIRIVYTVLVNPLLITWVLDEVLPRKRLSVRVACYAATIVLLFLGGWTLHQWGVVHFRQIGLWMYFPFKTMILIAALYSVQFARYFMRKDGLRHGPVSPN